MDFYDVLERVLILLQRHGRASYRALKRQFDLDDDCLDDLKDALLFAHPVVDENGRGMAWSGDRATPEIDYRHWGESESRFHALLLAVTTMLQRDRRVTYRTLKYVLRIDDTLVAEICKELRLRRLAVDEEGEVLVWTGEMLPSMQPGGRAPSEPNMAATAISLASPVPQPHVTATDTAANGSSASPAKAPVEPLSDEQITAPQLIRSAPEAERRQLTVMFCDLVGSTSLSGRLDPEDLREVVKAYQETAAEVIDRYEGHIAQYLGDGLLIYFGYPVAHENDAQRAVHTGLGIVGEMETLNANLKAKYGVELAVRIGIHTGPVVVGEMGGGGRHENLALGETPNIAARIEGLAASNTVFISSVTARLVQRVFALENLGPHELKGLSESMAIARVIRVLDSGPAMQGFDALVGREEEIGLLLRRWGQAKEGVGQVAMLSGEAGIGKSSLVEGLRSHVRREGHTRFAFRCSPYHTKSAFYPIIDTVQRTLGWQPDDTGDTKLTKLEQALEGTPLARHEAVALIASLLSLTLPEERYPPLSLSPQQKRQRTQDTLVLWLQEMAQHQPVLAVWEDLHWADPSTLEALELFIEQAPTASVLHLVTFRPEFEPPWPSRSHITPIALNRLEQSQAEALISHMADGKTLPVEVVAHIVAKTDGVPLYVEELTKMLLSSELLYEEPDRYVLTGPIATVAIPDTLQDSLMARLDQLNTAKEIAQLGAVLGREFSYEMIQLSSSQEQATLETSLARLVESELLYQRGRPPQATYLFKHALIQDTAYASLLKSTRQQHHRRIAQVLETQFQETATQQPELLAHHYTEAGLSKKAIPYWQQAGQRASERSAYIEAISHLTTGLEVLKRLPETPERNQDELGLQTVLGPVLMASKGFATPEVEHAYSRARELCQQVSDTSQLFPVLWGLVRFYNLRAEASIACDLGEQLLTLAERQNDSALILEAHYALSAPLFWSGDLERALIHAEQGIALYNPQQHGDHAYVYGLDPGAACLSYASFALWMLGFPTQAQQRSQESVQLARELSHPFSYVYSLSFATLMPVFFCREGQTARKRVEALLALSNTHGFPYFEAVGTIVSGWLLAAQGQSDAGIAKMRKSLEAYRTTGSRAVLTILLAALAEACGNAGHIDAGLAVLDEAREVSNTGERVYEAELARLEGELRLKLDELDIQRVEACFHKALSIARDQLGKSLELRAATSLARLWQSQGKRQDAYDLLAPVYNWFTEGFDTADLQDAKALLVELAQGE